MARPVWSGTISFGLVNVPVKAFTAVRDHDVHFHQLDKKSGSRIRYKKVNEKSGREVDADQIQMGFEVSDGRYVTFDKKELEELRPTSTRSIEVSDFVALEDVDPIYYERTYWLAPDGDAAGRAYQLLLAAMEDRERVAIGTVAMRNKQYLTAIRPLDGILAMSTMRFADEVVPRKDIDELPSRRSKPKPAELRMAVQLLDSLASVWDPKRYKDTYVEELRDRIEAKEAGKDIVVEEPADRSGADVIDLSEALQRSLDEARGGKRRTTSRRRKSRKTA
jgi:DNA end-binding protein Ku